MQVFNSFKTQDGAKTIRSCLRKAGFVNDNTEIAALVDVNEVSDYDERQLQEEEKAMSDPHLEADEVLEMVLKPEEGRT